MGTVAGNLERVRERIVRAAHRGGRDPGGIKLVAVSKGRPVELILEAIQAGQMVFGENRAQELRQKLERLDEKLEWHFIGTLQRNKVNMVVGRVALIHSIDSERLAEAVNRRAVSMGVVQEVLLQVNMAGEPSKHGLETDKEVSRLLEAMLDMPGVAVRGLMTIAPLERDPEGARPYFRALRELRDGLARDFPRADLDVLSMGMTQDFEVAVEEGANLLRVGTAIFA